jgi:transcriptional regulator with XRE-family HTH domain
MRGGMGSKIKFEVPEEFRALITRAMDKQQLSLRGVAALVGISPAFFCRIMTGERGLPDDEVLLRLGHALDIQPPEQVLVAAGRLPQGLKNLAALYLRTTGPLTKEEGREVMRAMQSLILKRQKGRGRS